MKLNVRNDSIDFGTNILTVEVPKALRNKVKSGIEYVDGALGGEGFTPSQVVLFTGTPGAGKTTMTLTMADRLTKGGAVVVFNTAEESLFQVKLIAERLCLKSGFAVGQETHVPTLLQKCDELRAKNPGKPFFLIVDSLQCMDDGHYNDGQTNSQSPVRALGLITDWCKSNYSNAVVIGQVTKDGKMAGSQKLKHMVDAMMELSIEEKDEDLRGCRVLQTVKNRFGGCGHTFYLAMEPKGFKVVAKVSAS
ncbi:AAA family ATPase [bacterium]|jgi:DNA repair protein RadA/Sms|nr:AAA family ATPase [bacterium]